MNRIYGSLSGRECKHYNCKCCDWNCIDCRLNKQFKMQAEQWIKILEIVNNATSELGNKLAKTLYTKFYLDEVFEDFSLLQDLEVDIPTDFIHLDMDMRERKNG